MTSLGSYHGENCDDSVLTLGHPQIKKLFPVHRPGGLIRAYWNFFFHLLNFLIFFFTFPPVHSSLKKLKLGGKKKKSRPLDDFLLKGGLRSGW